MSTPGARVADTIVAMHQRRQIGEGSYRAAIAYRAAFDRLARSKESTIVGTIDAPASRRYLEAQEKHMTATAVVNLVHRLLGPLDTSILIDVVGCNFTIEEATRRCLTAGEPPSAADREHVGRRLRVALEILARNATFRELLSG
ncbi:hypothetical protein K32_23610 [Kaistia sp. 32K]|uniref:hypothetical protein n=1 Tax=Kaistia sp. 32K TaxID=2795690 RepID=UPI0019161854|nr:hypothetical protein [Kaistia sp. 32K]BCP53744.1 hypothetical protein K32_23610 [Kaistia sp. 32K]